MSRFNELQKAFQAGFKKPDASASRVQSDAFDKLSLDEAKQAFKEGQRKRKKKKQDILNYRKTKYNRKSNSLIKS
jgi:hypothetical protein